MSAAGVGALLTSGYATRTFWNQRANAHCQVPCGIYDDSGRVQRIQEDVRTIKKAMNRVNALSRKRDPQSLNQATRWINTKESHASNIITVVSEYFLTQKVKDAKPGDANYQAYLETLAVHHAVMRGAMKAKQTTNPEAADALAHAVSHLEAVYSMKN